MPRRIQEGTFTRGIQYALDELAIEGRMTDPGRWQGVPTEGKPDLMTKELLNLQLEVPMDRSEWDEGYEDWKSRLVREIGPNLPWADDHFVERVGRKPTNPGEAYKTWPWWRGQAAAFEHHPAMGDDGAEPKFSHTYQERFWPRYAGEGDSGPYRTFEGRDNFGIRYYYGDLDDVVDLLYREPYTRQATFPIFFPEDTGAVHGGRVPCTLHYHFMLRDGKLHLWYAIRSCDAVRHFRDDLYLAARLCGWVISELVEKELRDLQPKRWLDVVPGTLFFTAYSFHVHMGDYHHLET